MLNTCFLLFFINLSSKLYNVTSRKSINVETLFFINVLKLPTALYIAFQFFFRRKFPPHLKFIALNLMKTVTSTIRGKNRETLHNRITNQDRNNIFQKFKKTYMKKFWEESFVTFCVFN